METGDKHKKGRAVDYTRVGRAGLTVSRIALGHRTGVRICTREGPEITDCECRYATRHTAQVRMQRPS
jgi:hypothetical protein